MTYNTDTHLDKLQIATVRLADTIHGFFAGNRPITTIDNARAISELIRGVAEHLHKKGLIESVPFMLSEAKAANPEYERVIKKTNRQSNFGKHSNKDPNCTGEYTQFDASIAMNSVTYDYGSLVAELMKSNAVTINSNSNITHTYKYECGLQILDLCAIYEKWMSETEALLTEPEGNLGKEGVIESYMSIFSNPLRKQKYLELIRDRKSWPIPHDAGINLNRDGDVKFKVKFFMPDSLDI